MRTERGGDASCQGGCHLLLLGPTISAKDKDKEHRVVRQCEDHETMRVWCQVWGEVGKGVLG